MNEIAQDFITWILELYDATIEEAADKLSYSLTGKLSSAHDIVNNINGNVITPIACQIIALCFLIEFLNILSREKLLKIETFVKIAFLVGLAKSAVNYSFKICEAIYNTCSNLIVSANNLFQVSQAPVKTDYTAVIDAFKDLGVIETIGVIIFSIPMIFVIFACVLAIQFIMWARYFEILILMCGCAIPMSFIPLGASSNYQTGHIVKGFFINFAAVCLQGLAIIAAFAISRCIVSGQLIGSMGSGDSGIVAVCAGLSSITVICLVLVVALFKSQQYALRWFGQ